MQSKYQQARAERREGHSRTGRFRGGKLMPVMAVAVRPSEGGALTQTVVAELDKIAGRLVTPPFFEVVSVFVPVQAMHALKYPAHDYPGNAEVVRSALLSGAALFGVEPEGEISKRMGINPRSVAGVKYVSEVARLAHNSAVNFLRRRKYDKAAQLAESSAVITPAILSATVLERLNGVLDPEDRVNGFVQMNLTGQLDVKGIGAATGLAPAAVNTTVRESDGTTRVMPFAQRTADGADQFIEYNQAGAGATPMVYADLASANGGQLSLVDLYQARRTDEITRGIRAMMESNPEYGDEMVVRFAHGLSVDPGRQPFVLFERRVPFARTLEAATDGASLGTEITQNTQRLSFTVPVPKTEFGGVVITFAVLKPDETLASQPHPFLSQEWGVDNFVADEMAIDPVPVTIRDLDSDCLQVDEGTVALYVGNNSLKRTYVAYGFNRHVDPLTVASKTAIWQLEIPMSVTPQTVIYPETLEHYPFADQAAEVCTYTVNSMFRCATPTIFGPSPVEDMPVLETLEPFVP